MLKSTRLSFTMSTGEASVAAVSESIFPSSSALPEQESRMELQLLQRFDLVVPNAGSQITLNTIRNTDGSIRWMWPSTAKRPDFLHFYTISNWKSKAFAFAAKTAFSVGLGRFFKQGSSELKDVSFSEQALQPWAIFTGTVGPNRKAILRIEKSNKDVEYRKWPFTAMAKANLEKEKSALSYLKKQQSERYFDYPEMRADAVDIYTQTSLTGTDVHTAFLPSELDLNAFVGWMESGIQKGISLPDKGKINTAKFNSEFILLLEKTSRLCEQHPLPISVPVHGDFTPWNCRMNGPRLQLLDWEMFQEKGIPLEDLFHFVYQQAILVDRCSFVQLRQRIQDVVNAPEIVRFCTQHQLNPTLCEVHYLNRLCHYYLHIYSEQEHWHMQVEWLLSTWQQSLAYLIPALQGNLRAEVLNEFQSFIRPLNYALLKFSLTTLAETPATSDIDLCTTHDDAQQMIAFFEKHSWVKQVVVKKLQKMIQLEAYLLNGSRIDLDLIFQFRRTTVDYLDASALLAEREYTAAGLWTASAKWNSLYVLRFYILNGSEVPEKHLVWTGHQPSKEEQKKMRNEVMQLPANKGGNKWKNRFNYFLEIMSSMQTEKGFLITFSGVDGAGKSTIIEAVKQELEKKHRRRVIVIRHRPSLLPIISALRYGKKGAEERSVSTLPRQGQNKSSLSSLFRFGYYLFDYVVGQWFVYFRHVRKNTIVLYDRYYFDFINDSRRSNISLSPSFTEKFYPLIRKPEFNFFLWASPEVILKRKQELDGDTIVALTKQYTELFARLQKKDSKHVYRCIENTDIGETVSSLMRNVVGNDTHETALPTTHSITES